MASTNTDILKMQSNKKNGKVYACILNRNLFRKKAKKSTYSRNKQMITHRCGCEPFVCHRFDQRDPETGIEPSEFEFYRNLQWSDQKGWTALKARDNYDGWYPFSTC